MEQKREEHDPPRADAFDPAEITAILDRWGKAGFFRARGWGRQIIVTAARPLPSYTLSLETLYERRKSETRKAPYAGMPVDSCGTPPGVWEVDLPSPPGPEPRRIERVIPHTEKVVPCEGCKGSARIDCPACGGSGRLCAGTQAEQGCPECDSQGWVPHRACDSTGRFRQWTVVIAEWSTKALRERLFSVDLPEEMVREAGSEKLLDQGREGGGFIPADLYPEAAPSLEALWRQSVPPDPGACRIVSQRYRIERVKGIEVAYQTPASRVPRKLWIVGDRQRVHAPQAPLAWGRVVGVALPAVAVAVPAMLLLLTSLISFAASRAHSGPATPGSPSHARAAPSLQKIIIFGPPAVGPSPSGMSGGRGVARPSEASGLPEDGGGTPAVRSGQSTPGQFSDDDTGTTAEEITQSPGNAGDAATAGLDDPTGTDTAAPASATADGYSVLVGTYTDSDEAQSVAGQIRQTAYQPTVTSAQDSGGTRYTVSVNGFGTREAAEEAVYDLLRRGIAAQLQSGTPETASGGAGTSGTASGSTGATGSAQTPGDTTASAGSGSSAGSGATSPDSAQNGDASPDSSPAGPDDSEPVPVRDQTARSTGGPASP